MPDHILERAARAMEGITEGEWQYRPNKYDDWGYVRGPGEHLVALARAGCDVDHDQHRRLMTDPFEANARFIAAAPGLVRDLVAEIKRLRGGQ